jgi:hypothetical protein
MIVKTGHKKLKWKFVRTHCYMLPFSVGEKNYKIYNKEGRLIVDLCKDQLFVFHGYAFDGVTGWFDTKKMLWCAGVHDPLLQLAKEYPEITKELAHYAFFKEMELQRVVLRHFFYLAVCLWGNITK